MSPGTEPIRFALVGSGWRTHFMLRVAAASAGRLVPTGVVVRSDAKAAAFEGAGVPVVRSVDDALATEPEFVVAAVDWAGMPGLITDLVERGGPVLAETPPAPDLGGLRGLWKSVGASGLVQVAEQYLLMPGHAARLAVVASGAIGAVTSVEVASTHMYHAVSLIRGFLGDRAGSARVLAHRATAPLLDGFGPGGWEDSPREQPRTTTHGILEFEVGVGVYDFVENQWWNPLRARRIVIRGTRGEIDDDLVTRWADGDVVNSPLSYRRTGIDMNLEGNELQQVSFEGDVVWRNPWFGGRLSEDDLAVAEILAQMGAHVRGEGPAPYPLADACADHALALAVESSATDGRPAVVTDEPWTPALRLSGRAGRLTP